jgi:hypothetical protein
VPVAFDCAALFGAASVSAPERFEFDPRFAKFDPPNALNASSSSSYGLKPVVRARPVFASA